MISNFPSTYLRKWNTQVDHGSNNQHQQPASTNTLNILTIPNKAFESHKTTSAPLNDNTIHAILTMISKSTREFLYDPRTISSIHINDPTIQNTTLEHRTTKYNAMPTMTPCCRFCKHPPTDHSSAPRSYFKSVRQFIALKSRRPSSICVTIPMTPNKALQSSKSTRKPLYGPKTISSTSIQNTTLEHRPTKYNAMPTMTPCFRFCN